MTPGTTSSALRSRALLSAAFLGAVLVGASVSHAQESATTQEAEGVSQNAGAMRGIEKSDIRRGQAHVGDVDSDGFGDPAPVARQADLKKLADELVNAHEPADGTGGDNHPPAATQGNAGNAESALNGGNEGSTARERIKMKRLEHDEVYLEPMDEVDNSCNPLRPCP